MTDFALGRLGPDPHELKNFFALSTPTTSISRIPGSLSYTYDFGPVENQGQFGACVTFAVTGEDEFFSTKHGYPRNISEAALYSMTKHLFEPDSIDQQGLYVGDALKVLQTAGYVPSSIMPYQDNQQTCTQPVPPADILTDHKVNTYSRVTIDPNDFMIALFAHGPIVIGTEWAQAWFTPDAKGFLDPTVKRADSVGGHAVVVVGYSKLKKALLCRNQWGTAWGIQDDPHLLGYFWMPFASVTEMVDDAYTVVI